jgi:hypothetical protein
LNLLSLPVGRWQIVSLDGSVESMRGLFAGHPLRSPITFEVSVERPPRLIDR